MANIFKWEKHFNYIIYKRLKQSYKHIIPLIEERGYCIDENLPSSPHWSYSLLKVGRKGCRDIRRAL